MMMNKNEPRFFATRNQYADESLAGFILRLCEANRLPTISWLLKYLNGGKYRPLTRILDVLTSTEAIRKIESLASLPVGTLLGQAMYLEYAAKGMLLEIGDYDWPLSAIALEQHQICPACLKEEVPYHRRAWSFVHAPVCTVHKRTLADVCHHCNRPIWGHRVSICNCHFCGADLRACPTEEIDHELAAFSALIQAPRTLTFGTDEFTEPLTPMDTFQIWRMALFPSAGESTSVDATYRSGELPLTKRARALQVLARSWSDGRLDSTKLRGELARRYAHLAAIPSPGLATRQLEETCRVVGLDPDIQHLLVHDQPADGISKALRHYGLRPPRLFSIQGVSKFLKITQDGVRDLARARLLTKPEPGFGYDADELYTAQMFLETLLSETQVDHAVGFEGGAAALEALGILKRWQGKPDQGGYSENELVVLFNRLFENVSSTQSTEDGKSLGEITGPGIDRSRQAYAIALAAQRGIDILKWEPPYRLTDMHFVESELVARVSY